MKFLAKNTEKLKYSSEKLKHFKERVQLVKGSTVFGVGGMYAVGLTDCNGKVEIFVKSTYGKQIEFKPKDVPLIAATMIIAKAECDNYDAPEKDFDCDNRGYPDKDVDVCNEEPSRKVLSIGHLMPHSEVVALMEHEMVKIVNTKSNVSLEIELEYIEGIVWAMNQLTNIKEK